MMRTFAILAVAILGVGVPPLASAQSYTGAGDIIRGNLTAAARVLAAEHRLSPDSPAVTLNLAVVYAQTDRPADARALYQGVLARPDEELTLASGAFVSSHHLAGEALRRLETRAVAAR